MAYKMAKYLIQAGRVSGMADTLGALWLGGALTDDQYAELAALIGHA